MSKAFFDKFKRYYSMYMTFFMSVFCQLPAFVQAYKVFITESGEDLSTLAVVMSFIAAASWLVYGLLLKDKPLIVANILGCIGQGLVIVAILIYC